jgi:SAM-dependent methyltransferase
MTCPVCNSQAEFFEKRVDKDNTITDIFICTNCHLLIAPSRVSENEQKEWSAEVYVNYSDSAENVKKIVEEYRKYINYFLPYIPSFSTSTLLDFGCGHGLVSVAATQEGFGEVFGIDLNIKTMDEVFKLIPKPDNFHYYNGLNDMPIPQVDAVLLNHVLEHLLDPVETLKKISFRLKRNGILFGQVPQYTKEYIFPGHFFFFCKKSLEVLFGLIDSSLLLYEVDPVFQFVTFIASKE